MKFESELIEGRLLRRYKRFFADIELPSGEVIVSHCPNPGSMKTCAPEGARAWVSRAQNPKRKLAYTWELVEVDGAMICVNTHRANGIVVEALEAGVVPELADFDGLRREVKYGEKSRVDILLSRGDELCYVEVKNVTLSVGDRVSAFPDSVTARGKKHLDELVSMVEAGHRAVLFFCVSRDNTIEVRPADEIDPVYGETLRAAFGAGVELLAYRCDITPLEIILRNRLPLCLE